MAKLSAAGVVCVILYLLALIANVVIDGQNSLEDARQYAQERQKDLDRGLRELGEARSDLSVVIAQNEVLSEQLRRLGVEPISVSEEDDRRGSPSPPTSNKPTSPSDRPSTPGNTDQPPPPKDPDKPKNPDKPKDPDPKYPRLLDPIVGPICDFTPEICSVRFPIIVQ
jgi:hypothetical protein